MVRFNTLLHLALVIRPRRAWVTLNRSDRTTSVFRSSVIEGANKNSWALLFKILEVPGPYDGPPAKTRDIHEVDANLNSFRRRLRYSLYNSTAQVSTVAINWNIPQNLDPLAIKHGSVTVQMQLLSMPTRSWTVAERPRDASCHWYFISRSLEIIATDTVELRV